MFHTYSTAHIRQATLQHPVTTAGASQSSSEPSLRWLPWLPQAVLPEHPSPPSWEFLGVQTQKQDCLQNGCTLHGTWKFPCSTSNFTPSRLLFPVSASVIAYTHLDAVWISLLLIGNLRTSPCAFLCFCGFRELPDHVLIHCSVGILPLCCWFLVESGSQEIKLECNLKSPGKYF